MQVARHGILRHDGDGIIGFRFGCDRIYEIADDGYGERDEQLVQRIPKENVPDVDDLPVGQTVYMQAPGGQAFPVKVVEITDDDVVFDMNHEMAGKDLNFEITLEEIVD